MSGALISTCDCCCDDDIDGCNDISFTSTASITLSGLTVCTGCCDRAPTSSDVDLNSVTLSLNATWEIDFDSIGVSWCKWQETITQGGLGTIDFYNSTDGSCSSGIFLSETISSFTFIFEAYRVSKVVRRLVIQTLGSQFSQAFYYPGPNSTSTASDTPGNPKICEELTNDITGCTDFGDCDIYSTGGTAVVSINTP